MKLKHIKAMIIATRQRVELKSYGYGFIDCKGNFYHKRHVQLLEVIE